MRSFVEYLWGWEATAPETIDETKWQETFSVYVEDKHNLGMKEFFDKSSPFAYQDMTARMVETIRKGYWEADEATRKKLLEEYIASVNRYGVGCAEHTCGNPRLQKYVMEEGRKAGIPVPALEGYQKAMERATGESVSAGAERLQTFVQQNEATLAARLEKVPDPSREAGQVEGYLMEQQAQQAPRNPARSDSRPSEWQALYASLPVLALLLVWRLKRRRS
jgi:cobaltochelatase CobN